MKRFYSVSVMTTANDNGICLTYETREQAEQARRELIADGCYHVSQVW